MKGLLIGLTSCAVLLSATAALACGDKLAALGGGVRYERLYRSQHPARIVLYAPRDSAGEESERLRAELARAGHSVEVVASRGALDSRLAAGAVDLVLADADAQDGEPSSTQSRGTAVVMGVRYADRSSLTRASSESCVTTVTRRGGRQLLRQIDVELARRARGEPATCAAPSGLRGT